MRSHAHLMLGFTCGAVALSLAACGSTGVTSVTTTNSSSPAKSVPSGAPKSSSSASSSTSTLDGGAGLSLSKLASYTNYAFTYSASAGGAAIVGNGAVHSLTDWRLQVSSPAVTTYDVGGKGYGTASGFSGVTPETFATPEGIHHLNGQYVSAQALIGMAHVYGEHVRKGGVCTVAGQSGTIYNLETPSNGILTIGDQACIATNGALLLFVQDVSGGASADVLQLNGAGNVFRVTAIGGVGPIAAP